MHSGILADEMGPTPYTACACKAPRLSHRQLPRRMAHPAARRLSVSSSRRACQMLCTQTSTRGLTGAKMGQDTLAERAHTCTRTATRSVAKRYTPIRECIRSAPHHGRNLAQQMQHKGTRERARGSCIKSTRARFARVSAHLLRTTSFAPPCGPSIGREPSIDLRVTSPRGRGFPGTRLDSK